MKDGKKSGLALLLAALLLAGCDGADKDVIYGYAEGRFRLLAPDTEGRIVELAVSEGQQIEAGATIARLDDRVERALLAEAQARSTAAAARLRDASLGGREPEVRAARELLAQAEAAAREANDELARIRALFEKGAVARAQLDAAAATARSDSARVAELRERATVVELPARENVQQALEADLEAAQAAVEAAREALAKRTVTAPGPGRIERVLREPGETAGPSAPIVRYLPKGALMAIGFIPEPQLGSLSLGKRLEVSCDGCAENLVAVVTSISQEAAFTTPIIFSDKERARLLIRLEATFTGQTPPSGTPLQMRLLP